MAFTEDGKWNFEDDSLQKQVTSVLKKDNPLMKQARTSGMQAGNRRGLLNSSMSGEMGEIAVMNSALPIASQDAKQIADKNLMKMDDMSKTNIAQLNVAAHDREKSMAGVAAIESSYAEMFKNIASNENLPSDARDKFLTHIGAVRDSSLNMVEQMYGIDLDWASTGSPG